MLLVGDIFRGFFNSLLSFIRLNMMLLLLGVWQSFYYNATQFYNVLGQRSVMSKTEVTTREHKKAKEGPSLSDAKQYGSRFIGIFRYQDY